MQRAFKQQQSCQHWIIGRSSDRKVYDGLGGGTLEAWAWSEILSNKIVKKICLNESERAHDRKRIFGVELPVFIEPLKPRNLDLENCSSDFEQQGEHYSFPIYFQSSERMLLCNSTWYSHGFHRFLPSHPILLPTVCECANSLHSTHIRRKKQT